jgi:hypothetical protein
MYAQVYIRLDIEIAVGLLDQWRDANIVFWKMKGTKNYNLT